MMQHAYVLISPARDEGRWIGKTIESVVAQTIVPQRWVIVDDGSSDETAAIVRSYSEKLSWIRLISLPRQSARSFSGKVFAFNQGLSLLDGLEYGFIGNLDADVYFSSNYFEELLNYFRADPCLGIGGGHIYLPRANRFEGQEISENSVAGAVQMFRKTCFDEIGGYQPIPVGGIDALAEIKARCCGWNVRTFGALPVYHPTPIGQKDSGIFRRRFYQGVSHYLLGYDPLFEVFRYIGRLHQPPFVVGSVAVLLGFCSQYLRRSPRVASMEVCQFLRREQRVRLWRGRAQFVKCGVTGD